MCKVAGIVGAKTVANTMEGRRRLLQSALADGV